MTLYDLGLRVPLAIMGPGIPEGGVIDELLAADATLADEPDDYKMRPLHWAARAGASDCAATLFERGVEIEAIDISKATPLHFAAHNGKEEIIWLLAESGADLDIPDASGRTALHLASYNGSIEAAEALIVLGASTTAKTKKGKTPLEVARMECRCLKTT